MLLGMPVVSSNVGGVADMMLDNKEGILVESGDVKGFSKAILEFFSDDEFAIKIGKNANIKALQTHDPEKNLRRLFEIYHEIGK